MNHPEYDGPSPAELLVEAQELYEDDKREEEELEDEWDGDDAYARDVGIPRSGPI